MVGFGELRVPGIPRVLKPPLPAEAAPVHLSDEAIPVLIEFYVTWHKTAALQSQFSLCPLCPIPDLSLNLDPNILQNANDKVKARKRWLIVLKICKTLPTHIEKISGKYVWEWILKVLCLRKKNTIFDGLNLLLWVHLIRGSGFNVLAWIDGIDSNCFFDWLTKTWTLAQLRC